MKTLNGVENNPPDIDSKSGWSPYKAKDFLPRDGLDTGYYNDLGDSYWGASSKYVDLKDSDIISNHISYYVTGNKQVANTLRLSLAVHNPRFSDIAQMKLTGLSKSLHQKALAKDLPVKLEAAIRNALDFSMHDGNKQISVLKDD
jgi:hypothetical protein